MEIINGLANDEIFGGVNLYLPLLSRCVFDSVCQIFAKFSLLHIEKYIIFIGLIIPILMVSETILKYVTMNGFQPRLTGKKKATEDYWGDQSIWLNHF